MPIALLAALAGSVVIHLATLFGTDVEFFGYTPEPQLPLQAVIQPLPQAPVAEPQAAARLLPNKSVQQQNKPKTKVAPQPKPKPKRISTLVPSENAVETQVEPTSEKGQNQPSTVAVRTPRPFLPPAVPVLPSSGTIRFAIYKESLGLQVGRAEHHWEFDETGRYRLTGRTETSGLAALFKPLELVIESKGVLVASGLQPETFRSTKNGVDSNENADFSWPIDSHSDTSEEMTVSLSRDGSVQPISSGTQDILSLNYQLAFLRNLEDGATLGVVTGKKYERYNLDAMGEEEIDIPAGHFRTLHLRAMTDNVTEIWIALDRGRLPVKIRFTDKKGESFEQVATEIGMP